VAVSVPGKSVAAASQNGSQTSGVAQLVGRRRARVPLDDLTACEREVLALMAEGRSNQASATGSSSRPRRSRRTETLTLDGSSATVAGTAGGDALLIGHGQVLRSSDGLTWSVTDEPAFKDWVARDLIPLADGRLFAAGDEFQGSVGSAMAVWTGTAEGPS